MGQVFQFPIEELWVKAFEPDAKEVRAGLRRRAQVSDFGKKSCESALV